LIVRTRGRTGAEILCSALEAAGVDTVFGLPGTQNIAFYEALRHSRLRAPVATHELGAAFMANGYARASGRPGVLTTIPGPGFTYALTGLAEAFLDSTPLVHIVGAPARRPGRRFALQAIDQSAMAAPVVKRVVRVAARSEIVPAVFTALEAALTDEPGPVLVEMEPALLGEEGEDVPVAAPSERPRLPLPEEALAELRRRIEASPRVLFFVGQGAASAGAPLRALAERLQAAVVATTSGRGVLAEDHPLSLHFDFGARASPALNETLRRADLVVALGCKFSHNGAHGFRLEMPREKLVQVDQCEANLGVGYPAGLTLHAEVGAVLEALLATAHPLAVRPSDWVARELVPIRDRAFASLNAESVEPRVQGVTGETPAAFFAALSRALPRDAILVVDSGLHQMLARRHFRALGPRGLLVPTNLQAMGFAIPAAIGARMAAPERTVVALVGDGGLIMSGTEILSAVRERLPLPILVFNDGHFGLIRLEQIREYGHAFGTELTSPDIPAFAASLGAAYTELRGDAESVLREVVSGPGVHLLEMRLGEHPSLRRIQAKAFLRNGFQRVRRRWPFR
jgi:acetolactate synthase-1/2/3 large subunit